MSCVLTQLYQVGLLTALILMTALQQIRGKHPIFLGPVILQFEKGAFLFHRFHFEMLTRRSQ